MTALFKQLPHFSPCRIKSSSSSMSSFWADACNHANNKSLQALLDAAHGSCGATVTRAAAANISVAVQLLVFSIAAACDASASRLPRIA
jgi:hypothetical protein